MLGAIFWPGKGGEPSKRRSCAVEYASGEPQKWGTFLRELEQRIIADLEES
jgi:hypothetical protein